MSFNMLLWCVENGKLTKLTNERLDSEDRLEQWIADDVSLLGLDILIIGRQVRTPSGGRIDLLAIDRQGDILLLELKRDRTPREVVAQALDYASWVAELPPSQVEDIAKDFLKRPLAEAFQEVFGASIPESINDDHRIVIVASELDDSSERIVQYLATRHSLNINVVFFTCFCQGNSEFVGRAWLLDPEEVEQRSEARRSASTELPPTRRLQLEWWTAFREALLAAKALPSAQSPRGQYWYNIALGKQGYHLSAIANVGECFIGVRVYMMHRYGAEAALNQLLESRAEIEQAVGEALIWDPNPEAGDKVILLRRKADIRIKDQWPDHLKWMVDAVVRLRNVFGPRVKALQLDAVGDGLSIRDAGGNA
jgi:hypothetical protein